MDEHPENWRRSINNHIHLLLYRSCRRIKLSDPVYKSFYYKNKNFYTAYGAYVHYKREFAIMKSTPVIKKKKGNIIDVVIEPNILFYEEVLEVFNNYKNIFEDLKKFGENKFSLSKNPVLSNLRFSFRNCKALIKYVIEVSEMLLDAIKKQESGKMDEPTLNNLKDIISYDEKLDGWAGWYVKLFDSIYSQDNIFNFYSWTTKTHAAGPIEDENFLGAITYVNLYHPYIGLIVKEDRFTKQKKLLLYSFYDAKETVKVFDPKTNFDNEIESITQRD